MLLNLIHRKIVHDPRAIKSYEYFLDLEINRGIEKDRISEELKRRNVKQAKKVCSFRLSMFHNLLYTTKNVIIIILKLAIKIEYLAFPNDVEVTYNVFFPFKTYKYLALKHSNQCFLLYLV